MKFPNVSYGLKINTPSGESIYIETKESFPDFSIGDEIIRVNSSEKAWVIAVTSNVVINEPSESIIFQREVWSAYERPKS